MILSGLGFGLIYLPAIVSVTVYFEKYRSLATGIAVCGSGLGTVVFSQFIKYLITFYGGYKFTMMILSAIVLNCIIFGIMFRPLKPVKSSECVPLKVSSILRKFQFFSFKISHMTFVHSKQYFPNIFTTNFYNI